MIDGDFTYYPDFVPRPILCDNNLSGLDPKYQDFIIGKFQAAGVRLLDANSGFEPKSFDAGTVERAATPDDVPAAVAAFLYPAPEAIEIKINDRRGVEREKLREQQTADDGNSKRSP